MFLFYFIFLDMVFSLGAQRIRFICTMLSIIRYLRLLLSSLYVEIGEYLNNIFHSISKPYLLEWIAKNGPIGMVLYNGHIIISAFLVCAHGHVLSTKIYEFK